MDHRCCGCAKYFRRNVYCTLRHVCFVVAYSEAEICRKNPDTLLPRRQLAHNDDSGARVPRRRECLLLVLLLVLPTQIVRRTVRQTHERKGEGREGRREAIT